MNGGREDRCTGRRGPSRGRILLALALLSLAAAYGYGLSAQNHGTLSRLAELTPGAAVVPAGGAEGLYELREGAQGAR